jgi:hypothetical protein
MIALRLLSIVAGCLACSACGPSGPSSQAGHGEPVGKFALITARGVAGGADTIYKVDTTTGETWRLIVAGWSPVPDAPASP